MALIAAGPRPSAAQSAPFARPDSTAGPDTVRIIPRSRFTADTTGSARAAAAARDTTQAGVVVVNDSTRTAKSDTTHAKRLPPPKLSGWHAPSVVMLQSLVFPGGGQLRNRAWWKAGAIGGTEGLLITRILDDKRALSDLSGQIDDARAAHQSALELKLVGDYNDRSNTYVGRQWWLGALLAYSLLDAYIDAHFRNFHVDLSDDPALPKEERGAAGLKLSFQERF